MKFIRLPLITLLAPLISTANDSDTLIKGVNASFVYKKEIFPIEWQKPPINAKAEPINTIEVIRSKNITTKALAKYPSDLLNDNLRAVYWLRKMSFYDVGYGGTNSTDALFLTNDGITMGYTDDYLEQTFHHEFSSILFRNYPSFFDTTAWKVSNKKDFSYNDPEDGVGAIRNNASSQELDSVLSNLGMLTQYAMSSLENDLNTYAQNLFCPSAGFWNLVDKYPRIYKKTMLLIAFYGKINPIFNEQFFRRQVRK